MGLRKVKEFSLVVVGNLAFSNEITDSGQQTCLGGGAYYSAVGASTFSSKVGLVSRVGIDFPLDALKKRHINTKGVKVIVDGKTPVFTLYQFLESRSFVASEMGLAANVDVGILPEHYLSSSFFYLATSLPSQHLLWIDHLVSLGVDRSTICAATFEQYVRDYPLETMKVLSQVGIAFMNQEEFIALPDRDQVLMNSRLVLTRGPLGAIYKDRGQEIFLSAPKVEVVDTTGAGDTLAGVFLALLSQDVPPDQALEKAVAVATQSVTKFGVEHIG